jgi:DNA-directed RNA polymerase specialized sigma24 family protein
MRIHGGLPGWPARPGHRDAAAWADGGEEGWCERLDLRHAVDRLPEEHREVAELLGEGLTEREMADRLGLSRGQFRVRRDATVRLLRRELGP